MTCGGLCQCCGGGNQIGACCQEQDGSCATKSCQECFDEGGAWQGVGTQCLDETNGQQWAQSGLCPCDPPADRKKCERCNGTFKTDYCVDTGRFCCEPDGVCASACQNSYETPLTEPCAYTKTINGEEKRFCCSVGKYFCNGACQVEPCGECDPPCDSGCEECVNGKCQSTCSNGTNNEKRGCLDGVCEYCSWGELGAQGGGAPDDGHGDAAIVYGAALSPIWLAEAQAELAQRQANPDPSSAALCGGTPCCTCAISVYSTTDYCNASQSCCEYDEACCENGCVYSETGACPP